LILLSQAAGDPAKLQAGIETWFDNAMSRVSGWYKRRSQLIILALAVLVAGITNADTMQLARNLSSDPSLRAAVSDEARTVFGEHAGAGTSRATDKVGSGESYPSGEGHTLQSTAPPAMAAEGSGTPREAIAQALSALQQARIPLGWESTPKKEEWPNKIVGLLLTAFAISMGAPFWFDMLNRVTRIRSTGTAPKAAEQQ
jgi:hypothetical protein